MRCSRLLFAALLTLATAACGGGSDDRQVLVDYDSEEFASAVFANYPEKLEALPGQTVEFKQAWTGEPHTVTGGTLINDSLAAGKDWVEFFEGFEALAASGADVPNPDAPEGKTFADFATALEEAEDRTEAEAVTDAWNGLRDDGVPLPDLANPGTTTWTEVVELVDVESEKAFEGLPFAFDDSEEIAQNVGQPCFKRTGAFPEDPSEPCSKAQQRQPDFDGKQSVYNSGLLRYEGVRGNSFKVKLAEDIEPGTYLFYCAVHGLGQTTELEVKPEGSEVESRNAVARRARAEAKKAMRPLERLFRQASENGSITLDGEELKAPFAGLYDGGHSFVNEFVPRRVTAKVNEPITWTVLGLDHTISFDVPEYFPILQFDTPRGVRLNPRLSRPAGGAAPLPLDGEEETEGPLEIDGGTYDGTGFWSSGLFGGDPYAKYTVRISKPGTYPYACLIHPPMIGQIVVTE